MQDDLVVSGDLLVGDACRRRYLGICRRAPVKLVRSSHEPAILVEEELVHPHLMTEGTVIELRVIHDERTALAIHKRGVVALRHLAGGHGLPLIAIHEQHATVGRSIAAIIHLIVGV